MTAGAATGQPQTPASQNEPAPPATGTTSGVADVPPAANVGGAAVEVQPAGGPLTVSGPAVAPIKSAASLGPLIFISQTLNNCGPASIAEVLRFWNIERSQGQVQAVLRGDGNTHGMSPFGVPGYVQGLGMNALMGISGSDALVKTLVSNGFPVIVSQWVSLSDHYGHYRPIEAYDDQQGGFIASDPYLGPNHFISYAEFDKIWSASNNRFMVIYPPAKEALLNGVLAAAGWDKMAAYQADLLKAQLRLKDSASMGNEPFGGFRRGVGELSVAWDEVQLGQFEAARADLAQAASQGASPTTISWIQQAIR